MQTSRTTWLVIGISSLIVTLILLGGFIYAVKDILYPQATLELQTTKKPNAQTDSKRILIAGIGDSLTKGIGDDTGKGYIGILKQELAKSSGKEVNIIGNLAVSGHRTDQLQEELKRYGVQYTLRKANLIVITIGGNDLFSVGQDEVDPKIIEQRMPEALTRLTDILQTVNRLNPKADIYYVGLYNPFSQLKNGKESSLAVQKWNNEVFTLVNAYSNMTFVPSYDLFSKNPQAFLSSDQFHPNQDGYDRMAKRIAQLVE